MGNDLFPIFLKLEGHHIVIIGGGSVALEKLNTLLANSNGVRITLIAKAIDPGIIAVASNCTNITLISKQFEDHDLETASIVVSAVNDFKTSEHISLVARRLGKLVNAADKPSLCDFYLGSIVKKGDLKIAISTNGKSPTLARRLKEMLNQILPGEIDSVLDNLSTIRRDIKGDFATRVRALDKLTSSLIRK